MDNVNFSKAVTKGSGFSVNLSNCGNPDYRQDPSRPLPETVCGWVRTPSLFEAARLCRKYMRFYELGGGNWNGGEITDANGLIVARVSANGRIWEGATYGGKEIVCAS